MENYIRIPKSILTNSELDIYEKHILGYLYTYQTTVVDNKLIPTKNYCFDTQENIANELGISIRKLKYLIVGLKSKGLIFMVKKSQVDGKNQYKNRRAIIMVDEFNPLPTKKEVIESKTITEPLTTTPPEDIKAVEKVSKTEDKTVLITFINEKYPTPCSISNTLIEMINDGKIKSVGEIENIISLY